MPHAFTFAELAQVRHFIPFHHDPSHGDDELDRFFEEQIKAFQPAYAVSPGIDGDIFELNGKPGSSS